MYKKIVNIFILEIILVIIASSLFFIRNDMFNGNSEYSIFAKKYIDLQTTTYGFSESDKSLEELNVNDIEIINEGFKLKTKPWVTIDESNRKIVSLQIIANINEDEVVNKKPYYKIYFSEGGDFSENNIQVEKLNNKDTSISLNKNDSKIRLDFVGFQDIPISKIKITTATNVFNTLEFNFLLIVSIICITLNIIIFLISEYQCNDRENLFSPIKKFGVSFKMYIKTKKSLIISVIFITLITYFVEICNYTFSIDETLSIGRWAYFTEWIYNGRFGITIFKSLFMLFGIFPPIFTSIISTGLLTIASLFWVMIVERSVKSETNSFFKELIFCGIFLTVPFVVPEYIIFNTFAIEVSLTLILLPIGIWLLMNYIEETNEKYDLYCAMGIIFLAVSVYQNFLAMIFVILSIYIYSMLVFQKVSNYKLINTIKRIMTCILILFGTVLAYGILFKIVLMLMPYRESLYISGFSGIGENLNLIETLKSSIYSIYNFMLSHKSTGSIFYLIAIAIFIMISFIELIYIKGFGRKLIFFCMIFIMIVSPYALWIAMLAPYGLPARSMHSLMLFCGACWYIAISILEYRRYSIQLKSSLSILGIIIMIFQAQYTSRVLYGDQIRLEQDAQIIHHIFYRIEENSEPSGKKIAFLNNYTPNKNNTILNGEIIGKSLLEWEATRRDFIYSLGYPYTIKLLNEEEKEYYESVIKKTWPNTGCILEEEDLIVVRLG